jgi:hypothetical protein
LHSFAACFVCLDSLPKAKAALKDGGAVDICVSHDNKQTWTKIANSADVENLLRPFRNRALPLGESSLAIASLDDASRGVQSVACATACPRDDLSDVKMEQGRVATVSWTKPQLLATQTVTTTTSRERSVPFPTVYLRVRPAVVATELGNNIYGCAVCLTS